MDFIAGIGAMFANTGAARISVATPLVTSAAVARTAAPVLVAASPPPPPPVLVVAAPPPPPPVLVVATPAMLPSVAKPSAAVPIGPTVTMAPPTSSNLKPSGFLVDPVQSAADVAARRAGPAITVAAQPAPKGAYASANLPSQGAPTSSPVALVPSSGGDSVPVASASAAPAQAAAAAAAAPASSGVPWQVWAGLGALVVIGGIAYAMREG